MFLALLGPLWNALKTFLLPLFQALLPILIGAMKDTAEEGKANANSQTQTTADNAVQQLLTRRHA